MAGLMVVGTSSGTGKSLLVTALCRIFTNRGLKVRPFKAQNMSLNSCVTVDGLEIGRAQYLQAIAAKTKPTSEMNPILLKPTGEMHSQVVVMGKALANMSAREYFKEKATFREVVKAAYQKLEAECDLVILEGAGSPAEINLKSQDIVNMSMAKMANVPVLLVGDIDRGGVFASLYGTVALLAEDEKPLLKGLIINKFRGDVSLLKSGLDKITELTNLPVVGVIPHLNIPLDEEDSQFGMGGFGNGPIEVAIVRLPRISNFTDFDALLLEDDLRIRFVTSPKELSGADLIIIPGTKQTIGDLRFLKESGLYNAIKAYRGIVVGICGGYQMLGQEVVDIAGWEESAGTVESGLGLLLGKTTLEGDKITKHSTALFKGEEIRGYEIHCGITKTAGEPLFNLTNNSDEKFEGEQSQNRVFGSYFHGLFDAPPFREEILNKIRRAKGLPEKMALDLDIVREERLDLLAQEVEKALDMELIERIIKCGV